MAEKNNLTLEAVKSMLEAKQGKHEKIHFTVFPKMLGDASIAEMELSQRAAHCLRRSGIDTVGALADKIDSVDDLMKIRGTGTKTAQEIMYRLFLYQYSVLSAERKEEYLKEVVVMNGLGLRGNNAGAGG